MDIHLLAIIATAGVFLAHLLLASLIRRTIIATIAGFSWQRIIYLKHFIWVKESSYSDYPDGSRNRNSAEESYLSYEFTHTRTHINTDINGNTSTSTEPVYELVTRYRTVYTYEIQRWRRSREVLAEGDDRNYVYWPDYALDETTLEQIDTTREIYQVFFQAAKGKLYSRELTQDEWADLDEQATYRLRVTLYGIVTDITPEPTQAMVMPEQKSAQ